MSKSTEKTIQAKLSELDELIAWFHGDEFELERASEKLKQAKELAGGIEHDLNAVENEIAIIKQSFASDA